MKKDLLIVTCLLAFILAGCVKEKINIDPTRPGTDDFEPSYLLTSAQLAYGNMSENQVSCIAPLVQTLSSTWKQFSGGDKYSDCLVPLTSTFFNEGQAAAAKLLEARFLAEKKDPDAYTNLIQVCRIMWVMTMQRMTDLYGDIPYSEAGRAKYGILYPQYDKQEEIYTLMLAELEDAIGKLDTGKPAPGGDLFYKGNISQWQKFGYSLMLRVAMRLTKAAPESARLYAEKTAGRTFGSMNDNAILFLEGGTNPATQNKTSRAILANLPQLRWSATFINYLKNNNDPRLYILTEKSDTGLINNNNIEKNGFGYSKNGVPGPGVINEVPLGMPNGYDLMGLKSITEIPAYPGYTGSGNNKSFLGNYARPKKSIFGSRKNLPCFIITYAQTQLLLAEARVRGWNVSGENASKHFEKGVTAALRSLEQIDAGLQLSSADIYQYLATHVLDQTAPAKSLKMINEQYWVTSLFDFPESWANCRRSGYPELTPVNYPGNITNGTIPRRFPYPLAESVDNSVNYNEALQRLGGKDLLTIPVWWDK